MEHSAEPLVDVHAHFVTPWYVEAAKAAGHHHPDGMPSWPEWTPEEHLRLMDAHGIEQAVLSISSPGVWFGDRESAVALSRRVNDYAADVAAAHPDRFRFFASVPLPAVDEAVAEADRAREELGAVGVVVTTNAGGVSLADPRVAPFLDELDRRRAVLFVHPTTPVGWQPAAPELPRPMVEFFAETTRVLAALLVGGEAARRTGLRTIVPHCGASLPVLVDRLRLFASLQQSPGGAERIDEGLARLWFDLAGTPLPTHAETLISRVGTGRLLYGSDYCWTPPRLVADQIAALDTGWRARSHGPWRDLTATNAAALLAGGPAR
ncbi:MULTISPECIES: amidohydrolase family protein [Streptomyces]|uniref:amidohydrolase family protein n=1 Tax=Streptomyces TaxID=1883 RepID=UPI001784F3C0|nr:amidohydrolase family protein [Streptomyces sp. ME02-6978.2a]MDX3363015.1 amidohydrolase family protein [Streptomyces sp. ME02-6978.2a]GHE36434.1 amidohydrolase [Streptomyces griseoaurantiacus]